MHGLLFFLRPLDGLLFLKALGWASFRSVRPLDGLLFFIDSKLSCLVGHTAFIKSVLLCVKAVYNLGRPTQMPCVTNFTGKIFF